MLITQSPTISPSTPRTRVKNVEEIGDFGFNNFIPEEQRDMKNYITLIQEQMSPKFNNVNETEICSILRASRENKPPL